MGLVAICARGRRAVLSVTPPPHMLPILRKLQSVVDSGDIDMLEPHRDIEDGSLMFEEEGESAENT